MKKFLYLCILLMVVACQHHYQYPPALQQADSLCVANPDSAVSLLRAIAGEMEPADKYVQMRYKLLTIKANDKAYITHTSDSLILSLVDYYEHGGDKDFLGEAYYYAGSTYRDLGDAPRALEYYQKALDAMPGDENLKVKSKVYAQMGDLLSYQDLTGEALLKYKQSYYYEKTRNDTAGMVYSLRDIGYTYRRLDNIDSAFYYYKKAESISSSFGDIALSNLITSQIAALYSEIGMYDSAKYYLQPSLEHLSRTNFSSIYSIASNLYYRIGQYDSVHYYDSELLKYGNQQAKLYAYYKQARIASLENKYEDAISLMTDFFLLNDSIQKTVDAETLSRMNALYNYQLRERENAKLELENEKYKKMEIVFVAGILIMLLLVFISVNIVRRKQLKNKLHIQQLKANWEMLRKVSEEEKRKNIREIESLNARLAELGETSSFQKVLAENQQTELAEAIRQIDINREQNAHKLQILFSSEIYRTLQIKIANDKHLSDKDVYAIEELLDKVYPSFIPQLLQQGKLNRQDYIMCLLMKFKIPYINIATLTSHQRNAITNARTKLRKRFLGENSTLEDFDNLISSL